MDTKEGQCKLASMYGEGDGVAKDDKLAVKWFTKASEQVMKQPLITSPSSFNHLRPLMLIHIAPNHHSRRKPT